MPRPRGQKDLVSTRHSRPRRAPGSAHSRPRSRAGSPGTACSARSRSILPEDVWLTSLSADGGRARAWHDRPATPLVSCSPAPRTRRTVSRACSRASPSSPTSRTSGCSRAQMLVNERQLVQFTILADVRGPGDARRCGLVKASSETARYGVLSGAASCCTALRSIPRRRPEEGSSGALKDEVATVQITVDAARAAALAATNTGRHAADRGRGHLPPRHGDAELARHARDPARALPHRRGDGHPLQVDLPAVGVPVVGAYPSVPIDVTFDGSFYALSDFLFRLRTLVSVRRGELHAAGRLFSVESSSTSRRPKRAFPSSPRH